MQRRRAVFLLDPSSCAVYKEFLEKERYCYIAPIAIQNNRADNYISALPFKVFPLSTRRLPIHAKF